MSGLPNARFEPDEFLINSSQKSCEDLTFKLKGFGLIIPIKWEHPSGSLTDGPEGVKITLSNREGQQVEAVSGPGGAAVFDEVELGAEITATLVPPKIDGKDQFRVKTDSLECRQEEVSGYECSNGHQFVLDGVLVQGKVKRADSVAVQATVKLLDAEKRMVSEVPTDTEGKYLIEGVGAGQYEIVPEDNLKTSEFKLQFKPSSLHINVEMGGTHFVEDLLAIGGGVIGTVAGLGGAPAAGVSVLVNGV